MNAMRREDRYEGVRGSQFLDYISKELKHRASKNAHVVSA
jgi:hypothetical protein